MSACRYSVVGDSGSGKTTLAKALAARLGLPYIELDAIRHQPGWVELPDDEFRRQVAERAAAEAWVVDGNYAVVRDLVWARAQVVVWLDLPQLLTARRVIGRTVRRGFTREELWNGNREEWRNTLSLNPERSVVLWSLTRHRWYRSTYSEAMADPANAHLRFVRLRSAAEVRAYLTSTGREAP